MWLICEIIPKLQLQIIMKPNSIWNNKKHRIKDNYKFVEQI